MDGDGQHPVSAVVEIANQLAEGDPLVFGVRDKGKGMPWIRSIMSDACALLTRPLCDMRDPMTGLFGLDRRIVQNKNLNPNTWKIGLEIAAKTGINGTPIMYKFRSRIAGESKASIKPAMQFLIQLIKLYLWKVDLGQMLKFCVVGTSGLVVNMGLLMGMVEMFGMDYRPAAIIGIGIAMVWNYAWNKAWTFRRGDGQVNRVGERADSIGKRQGKATSG
jgi:dolichol-phosphate mannosyltransferase